jgi:uncharacterized protein Yka (UPF0111/DUF47 family)
MTIVQPLEGRFYRLFGDVAANVRRGAKQLLAMLNKYSEAAAKAKVVKDIVHTGDELTNEIYDPRNRIVVTPFGREDIAAIASALDDILDLIEVCADDFVVYGVGRPPPASIKLATAHLRSV